MRRKRSNAASSIRLTPREYYILSWTVRYKGRSMLRLNGGGYWSICRPPVMYRGGSERLPSQPEGIRLVTKGLVTIRLDPTIYLENTDTGHRWLGGRAVITPKGREAMSRYEREHP